MFPRNEIYQAPNGMDPVSTLLRSERPTGPLTLLAVGRLDVHVKGLDLLIAALAFPGLGEIELDLVGPDHAGQRAVLEAQVEELGLSSRVRMHGMVPREQLGAFFVRADCFVQPSRREGASTAFAEAVVRGLPVIASDRNGLATYGELSSQPNILVAGASAREIADAIRAMAADLAELRAVAVRNVPSNQSFFSWDRISALHIDGYRGAN